MDETRFLKAQIATLQENLDRARKAMASDRIEDVLREAVKYRFEWKLREIEQKLETLLGKVDCGGAIDQYWKDLNSLREHFKDLFRECLAFLEGALIRSAGLDNGVCEAADALLRKLSDYSDCRWTSFTIMADEDLFRDISEIVRLRFPEFSIWHLPIVAHELGHYIGDKLDQESGLFAKLLEEEDFGTWKKITLKEQFADFFAVNALGPAFACSCIFLSFNPTMIFRSLHGHPSDNERVYFILKALEKIDEPGKNLKSVIDELNGLWQCSQTAVSTQGTLTADQTVNLDKLLDTFCSWPSVGARLENEKVRYKSWPHACILSEKLRNNSVTNILHASGNQVRLRDVINAAWHWRLFNPGKDFDQVGKTALDLCLKVIKTGTFDV